MRPATRDVLLVGLGLGLGWLGASEVRARVRARVRVSVRVRVRLCWREPRRACSSAAFVASAALG